MGVVSELEHSERFPLAETFDRFGHLRAGGERVAAQNSGILPFIRFQTDGGSVADVESALAADSSLNGYQRVTGVDGEPLYRITWVDRIERFLETLAGADAAVITATGDESGWTFRMLFPDREALSQLCEDCASYEMTVRKIRRVDEQRGGRGGLTPDQRAVLEAAMEHGYYAIPREIRLEELADRLGVSHQALSERIRRAHRQLIRQQLVNGSTAEERTDILSTVTK